MVNMYNKKKKKYCPFCRGKAARVQGDYICQNCGEVLNFNVMDVKTHSMIYSGGYK